MQHVPPSTAGNFQAHSQIGTLLALPTVPFKRQFLYSLELENGFSIIEISGFILMNWILHGDRFRINSFFEVPKGIEIWYSTVNVFIMVTLTPVSMTGVTWS